MKKAGVVVIRSRALTQAGSYTVLEALIKIAGFIHLACILLLMHFRKELLNDADLANGESLRTFDP